MIQTSYALYTSHVCIYDSGVIVTTMESCATTCLFHRCRLACSGSTLPLGFPSLKFSRPSVTEATGWGARSPSMSGKTEQQAGIFESTHTYYTNPLLCTPEQTGVVQQTPPLVPNHPPVFFKGAGRSSYVNNNYCQPSKIKKRSNIPHPTHYAKEKQNKSGVYN